MLSNKAVELRSLRGQVVEIASGRHACRGLGRGGTDLGGVGVDDAVVLAGFRPLHDDLLHVQPDHRVGLHLHLAEDHVEELLHVQQELLRDALARGVDGDLHVGRGKDQGGGEHGHADRLAEPPRGGDKDLLRQMVPAVELEDLLVVPAKLPLRLDLPEDPARRLQERVVEELLVVGAAPAPPVQRGQGVPAQLHPLEAVHVP
eukprot:397400-Hanusia_phi.AAC.1